LSFGKEKGAYPMPDPQKGLKPSRGKGKGKARSYHQSPIRISKKKGRKERDG